MADTLEDLAARCESATGPDRELDARVHLAAWEDTFTGFPLGRSELADCPRYTTSLDAAMALVPEGWYWRVGHSTLYSGWASTNRLHPDHCNPDDETFAKAATPALALCAASLRAIANDRFASKGSNNVR